MLKRIEALSGQGTLLDLPLGGLETGLLTQEVGGLGPVKATITSSSFASLDGSQFQSSRRDERNITLNIALEPDWAVETVEDLRDKIYAHFMPKSRVHLRMHSDNKAPRYISGVVETCEPSIFSAEPAVDISIICNDPDFVDPEPVVVGGMSTAATDGISIAYDGTVETGILFTLNLTRSLNAFTIYHTDPAGVQQQLDFVGDLATGDRLTIQTTSGAKYARLLHAGVTTSFLYGVSPQSRWIEIWPGVNGIRVFALGAPVPFSVEYVRKYGGM